MRPGGNGDFTALAAIGLGALASLAITLQATWTPPVRSVEGDIVVQAHRGPVATPGVAFYASNLDDSEVPIRGDFGGRVYRELGGIRMEAENVALSAGLSLPDGSTLVGIRLALVEATADGWREVRAGPTQSAALTLDERAIRLPRLGLTIPEVEDSEMVGRWLAVVHVVRTADGRIVEAAIHADESSLDRLMGWISHC